jgi:hypothetical protein
MAMQVPDKYADSLSLSNKILYVLSVLQKASADEVAMEIMELQGTSSEDGVADLTEDTTRELEKLCEEGIVSKLKEHRQKIRYALGKE